MREQSCAVREFANVRKFVVIFDTKLRIFDEKSQNLQRHTTARASLALATLATLALARASRIAKNTGVQND